MQIDPVFDAEPVQSGDPGDPQRSHGPARQRTFSLEALEADIAAVGSAMETVDAIVAGVASGEGSVTSAAAEITAVVSHERFATP